MKYYYMDYICIIKMDIGVRGFITVVASRTSHVIKVVIIAETEQAEAVQCELLFYFYYLNRTNFPLVTDSCLRCLSNFKLMS